MTTREITIKESKGAFSIFKKTGKEADFSGISSLRQLLTKEKARILNIIKTEKPASLYDLSKKLNRRFKAVYEDVKLLERFGLIELIEEKVNNRTRHKPQLIINTLTVHIKI